VKFILIRKIIESNYLLSFIFSRFIYYGCALWNKVWSTEIEKYIFYNPISESAIPQGILFHPQIMGHCSAEIIRDNSYYGHGNCLREYIGSKIINKVYIEHGLFFGDYLQVQDSYRFSQQIITMSKKRAKFLEERLEKSVIAIGPYINYVNNKINDEELIKIKNKYGRIALHFFHHTNRYASIKRNYIQMESLDYHNKFDTKMACVYYTDLHDTDFISSLKNSGYIIITAGHKFDPNFIVRLRSFIDVSEQTSSDYVGTHVGYCIARSKPHYIVYDEDEKIKNTEFSTNYLNLYGSSFTKSYKETSEIYEAMQFGVIGNQKSVSYIFKKYWGGNLKLTVNQFKLKLSLSY
jgi:hypothetical protein